MNGNLQAVLFSVLRKTGFQIFFLPQSDSFLVIAKYIDNSKLWRILTWPLAHPCEVAYRLHIYRFYPGYGEYLSPQIEDWINLLEIV